MTATAANWLKDGAFSYVQDDDWAKIPSEYQFPEAAGVETDKDDNVYIFNRGPHPVVVLDKNGNFVRSFGEETFTARAHGIHISVEHQPALLSHHVDCDMRGDAPKPGAEFGLPRPAVERRHGAQPRFLNDILRFVRISADDPPRRLKGTRRVTVVQHGERRLGALVSNGGHQRLVRRRRRCVDRVDHPHIQSNGRHGRFADLKAFA